MKMKFALLWLILFLAFINAICALGYQEMEEIVPVPSTTATVPTTVAEFVTGVCTFGNCPVATTAPETTKAEPPQNLAETSQTEDEPEAVAEPEQPESWQEEPVYMDGGTVVTCWVTAYCGCWECSGEYGPYDVFGNRCIPNHTIGVDPSVIPYGTQVEINGIVYTASDTGSAINGYEIDVYHETHAECKAWPTGYYEVTIY